eukprot:TRINITY_DN8581_c0_g1_i1.p1 TRINITY_DN8581_c0_g1~~TRINITY_DN8581_c0_g1_i1.p1  ORF type:complete len:393 (-),score=60.72 TRINITY_DN8581_c0_g1_i1:747-1856(-)
MSMLAMVPNEGATTATADNQVVHMHDNEKISEQIPTSALYLLQFEHDKQNLLGNCKSGQLTALGVRQMAMLGQRLRELYIKALPFLSDECNTDEIYVRSTHTDRTIESAQSVIWGLYPIQKRKHGETIVINLREQRTENMYPRSKCARYAQIYRSIKNSPAWKERVAAAAEAKEIVDGALGRKFTSWVGLNSTLQTTVAHELELPEGMTPQMIARVEEEADWAMKEKFSSAEGTRIGIGRFVQDLVERIERTVQKQDGVKFALFSGHDNTLSPLLSAFRVGNGKQPAMASYITIEVYRERGKSGSLWVRFLYNADELSLPGSKPVPVRIKRNGQRSVSSLQLLPYDKFRSLCNEIIPQDYEKECERIED